LLLLKFFRLNLKLFFIFVLAKVSQKLPSLSVVVTGPVATRVFGGLNPHKQCPKPPKLKYETLLISRILSISTMSSPPVEDFLATVLRSWIYFSNYPVSFSASRRDAQLRGANPGSGQIDRHGDNCSGESGLGSPERAGPAGEGEDREAGRCCAFPFVSVSEQKQHLTFQLRRSEPPLRLGTTTANGPRA